MDSVQVFSQAAAEAAKAFEKIPRSAVLRVVSHIDTDGICSAAILVHALSQDNRRYQLSMLPTIDDTVLEDLAAEDNAYYIFTDFGSGQLKGIMHHLEGRKVFILDHHVPETKEVSPNIVHLNPHVFGIDGSNALSGSGVVYFFTKALLPKSDLAHIAVIGAIGDIQDQGGFSELNRHILDAALTSKKMAVKRGFRFFGLQTRSLHKLLEYSTDVYVPGVTGSESGAIQFLRSLEINPKVDNHWKRLHDLSDDELRRLAAGIIMRRKDEDRPDDIFTDVYILPHEDPNTPFYEAKEFSTLLNACGRMDKASLGIGACLDKRSIKTRALKTLVEYRRKIMKAITWFQEHKDKPGVVTRTEKYMIIDAGTAVMATMIGTLASILSKSGEYPDDYVILSMARNEEGQTKISIRAAGRASAGLDLQALVSSMVELVGSGQAGGHQFAAGAIIDTNHEHLFVKAAKKVLADMVREELI